MKAETKSDAIIRSIEDCIEMGEPDERTLAEKFDDLHQELLQMSYEILIKATKRGYRLSEDESYMQTLKISQLNVITKLYMNLKKAGRIADTRPNDNFDSQLLNKIKNGRKSAGEIVQSTG